jgi:Nucleotide modification associated domain 2
MVLYSYVIEHDLGLAPNPFGRYCTLAVCKPKIRGSSKLNIGDWVLGTGSKALEKSTGKKGLLRKLIYTMKVTDRVTLEDYWTDGRFQYKKPRMNGSRVAMFGDNFYHKDESGKWIQEDSAHSKADGSCNPDHLKTDTSGRNVLISEHFYYFGGHAPTIPNKFLEICHSGIGEKKFQNEQIGDDFINWVTLNFNTGIHGDPLNWERSNQLSLF